MKLSGQYINCPHSIQTVQTVFKLSRNNQHRLEENSLKTSILPRYGLHCADKCGPFSLLLHINRAKTFRTRKNFPVNNADALTGFLALCTGHQAPAEVADDLLWFMDDDDDDDDDLDDDDDEWPTDHERPTDLTPQRGSDCPSVSGIYI